MDKVFAEIDDFVTTLWIETAGLIVALSLVFAAIMKMF